MKVWFIAGPWLYHGTRKSKMTASWQLGTEQLSKHAVDTVTISQRFVVLLDSYDYVLERFASVIDQVVPNDALLDAGEHVLDS